MGLVDLRPELIISFQIDPLGPREGDPVNPITVIMENQGRALAGPTKAFFGYFPFFGSGSIFFTNFECPQCKNIKYHGRYKGPGTPGLLLEWSAPSVMPGQSLSFRFKPSPVSEGKNSPVWMLGKYSFVAQVFQAQQEDDKRNSKIILVQVTQIQG
jgi:hypothetical protein